MMQAAALAFARGDEAAGARITDALLNKDKYAPQSPPPPPVGKTEADTSKPQAAPTSRSAGVPPTDLNNSNEQRDSSSQGAPSDEVVERLGSVFLRLYDHNMARNGGDKHGAVGLASNDMFGKASPDAPPGAQVADASSPPTQSAAPSATPQEGGQAKSPDMSLEEIQKAYQQAQARGDTAQQQALADAYVQKEHSDSPGWMAASDTLRTIPTGVPILGGALNNMDAFVNAPFSKMFGDGKAYQEALDYQNARDRYFDQNFPFTSRALQFAGGIAAGAGVLKFAGPAFQEASFLMKTLLGGGSGTAIGGADGFIRADGDFQSKLNSAGKEALFGGVVGLLGPGIEKGASSLAKWGVSKYSQLVGSGVEQAAEFVAPARLALDDVGEKIGEGTFKDVYLYQRDPRKVISVLARGSASEAPAEAASEIQALGILEKRGLPVVKNYGSTTFNGRPAIISDYIDGASSRSILDREGNVINSAFAKFLNKSSIADLESIRSAMTSKGINVEDLQFMVRRDGKIFINDPRAVISAKSLSEDNARTIEELIDLAKTKK